MLRYVITSLIILRAETRLAPARVDTLSYDSKNVRANPCSDSCFLLGNSVNARNSLNVAGGPLISRHRFRLSFPSKSNPSSPLQYAAQTFVIVNRPCPSATEWAARTARMIPPWIELICACSVGRPAHFVCGDNASSIKVPHRKVLRFQFTIVEVIEIIDRQEVVHSLPRCCNGKPAMWTFMPDGRDASGNPWKCIHRSSKRGSHMLRDSIALNTSIGEEKDLVRIFGKLR